MNNEETIYQPMGEDETTQIQKDLTEKSSEGKKTAATVGSSFLGGMGGAVAATVGMDALHDKDEEAEDKTAEDASAENPDAAAENPDAANEALDAANAEAAAATAEAATATAEAQPDAADVKPEPQPAPQATAQSGSANAVHAGSGATAQTTQTSYHEPDYTGHGGADPVSEQPHTQTTGSHQSEGSNEVQVLGIYGEHGQSLQTAVLTDGEYVAAVVDIDGDGQAEVMAVDADHNGEIGEGEVFDVTSENVPMAGYEQAYVAQQNDASAYEASEAVADNGGGNEVQILGMYEAEGDYGQTMQAAVFTNGVDVAAVVDVNGDGRAEVYVQDVNGNGQIEQNEIADISNNPVEMSPIEQAYALQQQAEAQEMNTIVYNATDEQPDFNNGMDTLV